MPVVDKNQLKIWFKNLSKPVQEQFWNWMDSFYHKNEPIPKSGVENLTNDLAKKADLVGGVVPASQLPFSVNTSEVIAIGTISATENTVTLAVHSSGTNAVRINGVVLTRTFPNTFNFTPVTDGSKFLIIYAINDSGIFRLAEGVEDLEAVEPEIPVGALFVRRILINSAGADVELPSLTGFKEKIEDEWKTFTFIEALTPKLLPFSTDKKTSFLVQKSGDFIGDLHLGGIKVNETGLDYWWSGKEFTIKNNTSNNLILLSASNYTGVGIKFNLSQNLTVGAGKSIKVKASIDGSLLEVLEFSSAVDLSTKQDRLQSVSGNTGVGKADASATEKLDIVGRTKSDGQVFNETTSAILPKEIKFKDGKFKAALADGVEKSIAFEGDSGSNLIKSFIENTRLKFTPTNIDYVNGIITVAESIPDGLSEYQVQIFPNCALDLSTNIANVNRDQKSIPYEYLRNNLRIKKSGTNTFTIRDWTNNLIAVNLSSAENAGVNINYFHLQNLYGYRGIFNDVPKGAKRVLITITGYYNNSQGASSRGMYLNVHTNNTVNSNINLLGGASYINGIPTLIPIPKSNQINANVQAILSYMEIELDITNNLGKVTVKEKIVGRNSGADNFSTASYTLTDNLLLLANNEGFAGLYQIDYMYANGTIIKVYKLD